jgi:hypothetical protein
MESAEWMRRSREEYETILADKTKGHKTEIVFFVYR